MAAAAAAALGLIVGLMSAAWLIAVARRDTSVVDVFWGPAFAVLGWFYLLAGDRPRVAVLTVALVTLWAGRLAVHIALRSRGRGEDRRYAAMRAAHPGTWTFRSLFTVFWLQAILAWSIGMPLLAVQSSGDQVVWLAAAGLTLAGAGLLIETAADWQLARFRTRRRPGQVMDSGLWRYSRHPNYFGECVFWWGVYVVGASAGGWWAVPAPVLLTWLLLRVSGVPLLERDLTTRFPAYAEYVRRTSAFLPRPPRA